MEAPRGMLVPLWCRESIGAFARVKSHVYLLRSLRFSEHHEAAIAAFGALFAGIFGLFASYCRKSRLIRIIYAFLSLRKCFLMIIKNC